MFETELRALPDDVSPAAILTADLSIGTPYLLRIETKLVANDIGGVIFDQYSPYDFKFAVVSALTNQVLIGHHTARNGWVVDAAVGRSIDQVDGHNLTVTVQGTTVSVELDGRTVLGYSYNANAVDGNFGLLSRGDPSSFAAVTISTNDPAYLSLDPVQNLQASITPTQIDAELPPLTEAALAPIVDEAIRRWRMMGIAGADSLGAPDRFTVRIVDLPGTTLGQVQGDTLYVDEVGAGLGWFVDPTPRDDHEFLVESSPTEFFATLGSSAYGQFDLLTVVTHEVGHLIGLEHTHGAGEIMAPTLEAGVRITPPTNASVSTGEVQLEQIADSPLYRPTLTRSEGSTRSGDDRRAKMLSKRRGRRTTRTQDDSPVDAARHAARAARLRRWAAADQAIENRATETNDDDWRFDEELLELLASAPRRRSGA